ncbi:MAG: FAD binding domain-containing protein [Marmoricola sp.]
MEFLTPTCWAEALQARAAHPGAVPIAGGTDVMVELNFDRHRPDALIDLTRIPELAQWEYDDGLVRLGAGVSYTRVIEQLGTPMPGLAMASRTVGSPQIRNRGTVGGNLGAASPAGDAHPPLLAVGARVEVESIRGVRTIAVEDFYTGVKHNALAPDELIGAILVPRATGPQQFCKIGTRNAMVISVAAFGLALDPEHRRVGTGVGSAAPTPRRAVAAEEFLAGELGGLWESRGAIPESLMNEFGERVRQSAAPIDDVRGTAAYRLHSLAVMARRALGWAWAELQTDYRKAS